MDFVVHPLSEFVAPERIRLPRRVILNPIRCDLYLIYLYLQYLCGIY
jgi:hypothetical protein